MIEEHAIIFHTSRTFNEFSLKVTAAFITFLFHIKIHHILKIPWEKKFKFIVLGPHRNSVEATERAVYFLHPVHAHTRPASEASPETRNILGHQEPLGPNGIPGARPPQSEAGHGQRGVPARLPGHCRSPHREPHSSRKKSRSPRIPEGWAQGDRIPQPSRGSL